MATPMNPGVSHCAVRVNRNRLRQLQETAAQQIGVACPFCMIMLEDARGAAGAESLLIRDVAEVVADALVIETAGPMPTITPP